MERRLLHTPEGVRDLYGEQCENKLLLQEKMHRVLRLYGFRDIQMPSFEFFDIFNKERGSVASKNMFKFFDREGNTLVLRPDMTPQTARCAAKYFYDEQVPIRLCYLGNTFVNKSSYQGRLKENTQLGCELIGVSNAMADAEMLIIMIEAFLSAGLTDFQIELGHTGYFEGLADAAGFDGETKQMVRNLIREKNYFGLLELLNSSVDDARIREALYVLPQLFGQSDKLMYALKLADNETSQSAVKYLLEILRLLGVYGYDKYISFDLGLLMELTYYTGIIFQAVTYEVGEPVGAGGRYDRLIGQFGKDMPSIGFSINVDLVRTALSRQGIGIPTSDLPVLVLYKEGEEENALMLCRHYRDRGVSCASSPMEHEIGWYESVKEGRYGGVVMADEKTLEDLGVEP